MSAHASLYSIETEQALLGALMLDGRAFDRIEVALTPEHFYRVEHQRIFRAIRSLVDANRSTDENSVIDALEQSGDLPSVGGLAGVIDIAAGALSAANVRRHAEIVAERAMLRALTATADEISGIAAEVGLTVTEKVNAAQAKVMALSDSASLGEREPQAIGDLLPDYLAGLQGRWENNGGGTPTGYPDVDRRLNGGMGEGWLIIIPGRPGMGKTTFAMNIAEHVAEHVGPVLFCSQEMPNVQLIDRVIASLGRIPQDKITQGGLTPDEHESLRGAVRRIQQMPLILDEQGALRIEDVRRKARRTKNRRGLALIVVDYLQLMVGEGENRNQELTKISGGLKALAKELRVPVIALSQLNRSLEQRPNKRPVMSDLRESGAIEQDADVILAPYRDEEYNPDSPYKGLAELLMLKFRHGKSGGFVPLAFRGEYSRFESAFEWPKVEQAEAKPKRRGFDV